jgi:hypothetical protein
MFALLLIWLFGGSTILVAQYDAKYYRQSATTLLVDSHLPQGYEDRIKQAWTSDALTLPSRIDHNPIEDRLVSVASSQLTDSTIELALVDGKISNQLVSFWWSRQADGSFKTDQVAARGAGTATVSEMVAAQSSLRSLAEVKDDGEKLIDESRIIVYDFNNIRTFKEIYDEQDRQQREIALKSEGKIPFTPVERVFEGYKGSVTIWIYQLEFLGEPSAVFYNDLWVDESMGDSIRSQRKAAFDQYPFPVRFVTKSTADITGSQRIKTNNASEPTAGTLLDLAGAAIQNGKVNLVPKTTDQLFADMINMGRSKAFSMIMGQATVTTGLVGVRPIQARIGTREDLKIDSRYFVYEFKIKNNGDTAKVRKAVIRARKVAKNTLSKDGLVRTDVEPSEFYRITGVGLDQGMLLEEHDDAGVFVTPYFAPPIGDISGGGLRLDYMVSKFGASGKPGVFVGLLAFAQITDKFGPSGRDVTFFTFGGGVRKEYYLMSNVRVGVGIDGGVINLTDSEIDDDDDENVDVIGNAYFGAPYAEFGLHVWHNIQLVAAGRYFLEFGAERGENYIGSLSVISLLSNRNNLSVDFGVRVNF